MRCQRRSQRRTRPWRPTKETISTKEIHIFWPSEEPHYQLVNCYWHPPGVWILQSSAISLGFYTTVITPAAYTELSNTQPVQYLSMSSSIKGKRKEKYTTNASGMRPGNIRSLTKGVPELGLEISHSRVLTGQEMLGVYLYMPCLVGGGWEVGKG